ncbi:TrbC/VirB2 family protein [Paracoccus sp. MBLB3053]|uniref:TrbC/VirB2 family protein n=1 Tax=Paracoccus aurantius TaxID=3073814 RepID=A0ABU2HXA0_9RHOB|nr:TrbC/VirB2 family protein [Paracoccus sp. MBLB3053]MDS9469676.1 TrbC/VirB2 family protein [Paracoccus sp. MBLB3053]
MFPNLALRRFRRAIPLALSLPIAGFASRALAQANQGIDFTKANTLGNNWTTWIMGNPVVWFFSTAFVIVGIMAALNRAPWAWLLYIIIGAIIAMPASTLVSNLNSFL